MPENQRSSDHAGERQLSVADVEDASRAPSSRATSVRHLYVVRNTETQQEANAVRWTPTTRQGTPPGQNRANGMLDRSVQVQIGRMLRDVFADVAEEPVPDRFVRLLEALEAKEKHQ